MNSNAVQTILANTRINEQFYSWTLSNDWIFQAEILLSQKSQSFISSTILIVFKQSFVKVGLCLADQKPSASLRCWTGLNPIAEVRRLWRVSVKRGVFSFISEDDRWVKHQWVIAGSEWRQAGIGIACCWSVATSQLLTSRCDITLPLSVIARRLGTLVAC